MYPDGIHALGDGEAAGEVYEGGAVDKGKDEKDGPTAEKVQHVTVDCTSTQPETAEKDATEAADEVEVGRDRDVIDDVEITQEATRGVQSISSHGHAGPQDQLCAREGTRDKDIGDAREIQSEAEKVQHVTVDCTSTQPETAEKDATEAADEVEVGRDRDVIDDVEITQEATRGVQSISSHGHAGPQDQLCAREGTRDKDIGDAREIQSEAGANLSTFPSCLRSLFPNQLYLSHMHARTRARTRWYCSRYRDLRPCQRSPTRWSCLYIHA